MATIHQGDLSFNKLLYEQYSKKGQDMDIPAATLLSPATTKTLSETQSVSVSVLLAIQQLAATRQRTSNSNNRNDSGNAALKLWGLAIDLPNSSNGCQPLHNVLVLV